ncbi:MULTISPECIES: ArnT family glycosyltransferase [Maribacter]|uniref:Glycosyltransferase family 39 protein n=1 Tax=Maribacter flavus TaxID=1658664 RepID=A0A5B2TYS6_9FLAO|nr:MULTISPECIES: glycosyltransferase family 39 protein [Maribacter]KAA2219524.1 phospholipid carrier-dependent glycosyltransferase [Maribacter flavus]MDC6404471.1 glycosyltransferase family 39 protein [Maribacter sp. PR66]MEE1971615.1 glycosyltransferase family 39 protein [Maribacter flavus]
MNPSILKESLLGNSQLKSKTVFLLLTGITFFIRFPFFFRDYIDRDESTFILLGQSWVDGYLPYTQLWDLKPPLTFAFFASIIFLFGKSFVAIRLLGALLVATTAFFTYKITSKMTTTQVALWCGIFCIVLLSLFGSLQGVMSEHLCMAFFVPSMYLIISKKGPIWLLLAGLLMGIAVMVKLNMAYPVLLLGLFLVIELFNKQKKSTLWNVLAFGTGVLLVILLTILPYYMSGQLEVWWKSVILAPLEYSEARRFSLLKLAPTFIVIGVFLFYCWKNAIISVKDRTSLILFMAICGVLFSFFKGGRINGHYLIQIHPMLVIFLGIFLNRLFLRNRLKISRKLLFLLLLIPAESYMEYVNIVKNKIERGTFFNGEGFTVPKYILENKLETDTIFFLGYHIGYWNLGVLPPTLAATHPSNICRDELYPFFDNPRKNSLEELKYIMEEIKPKTVVVRKGRLVFDRDEFEENEYIDAYLAKHYTVAATVEKAEILQRKEISKQ